MRTFTYLALACGIGHHLAAAETAAQPSTTTTAAAATTTTTTTTTATTSCNDAGTCSNLQEEFETATAREQFLLHRLEAATEEVRRQVKLRHRQVSGACSDYAGLQQLSGEPSALRVGTFNLWNLNSNWPLRQRGIQSMLAYLKADIVAVQEIRWLPGAGWPAGQNPDATGGTREDQQDGDGDSDSGDAEANADESSQPDAAPPCAEDEFVVDHVCTPCPEFEFNAAGDDPEGDDTACAVRYNPDGTDPRLESREAQVVALAAGAGYDYFVLRSAAAAARSVGANWTAPGGFDEEAVGLLSRHPIVDTQELPLPPPWDAPDRNPRVILAPLVNISSAESGVGLVRVLSSHLSYEKMEQCRTVPLVRAFADRLWQEDQAAHGFVPQLIMGDLNTYFDFEWPFDVLTEPEGHLNSSPLHPCGATFANGAGHGGKSGTPFPAFKDVWTSTKPASDAGYTFPNPETATALPPARCDRILSRGFDLLSKALEPSRTAVIGCEPMAGTYMSDHRYLVADFLTSS